MGTVTLAAFTAPLPAPTAQAALSPDDFQPGMIISDRAFYDSDAMTAAEVQSFLNIKGSKCVAGEMPCLKDYRETTRQLAADSYCSSYPAQSQSAAEIIAGVARACGVSPEVLLVLLQKESSLVTKSRPTATNYRSATGFGCPDTAPCDAQYYGYFNQVYRAARQYQVYRAAPTRYGYQAGRVNSILYHPDAACGRGDVFIENQATAGLYIYTPYQPNAAALRNLYGTGDACSSYGNRNFWRIFTEWFGSTSGFSVSPQMQAEWDRLGGADGALGVPTADQDCSLQPAGCVQPFSGGVMYWSPGTDAKALGGEILIRYRAAGAQSSGVGYPTTTVLGCPTTGCTQTFQNGAILWSAATGAQLIGGAVYDRWKTAGGLASGIGYPTTTVLGCPTTGCTQTFQNGAILWSAATGAQLIGGAVYDRWKTAGGLASGIGYPTTTVLGCPTTGCTQTFQNGAILWSAATGAQLIGGAVYDRWKTAGGLASGIGYPTTTVLGCPTTGCTQTFQNGAITWYPAGGAHLIGGEIHRLWASLGGPTSRLGLARTTVLTCAPTGCTQQFQHGAITWTAATGPRTT